MGASSERWARRRRFAGRSLIALVLAGTVAGGAYVARIGPRRLKHTYSLWRKISKGKGTPDDLVLLGREGRGLAFVQRFLEDRCRDPHAEEADRGAALRALARDFPDGEEAQAVREFETLVRGSYFHDRSRSFANVPQVPRRERIARWREFCRNYTEFPGRDNAGLELARCLLDDGETLEAALVLLEALEWGDGDCVSSISGELARTLSARLRPEESVALADNPRAPRFRLVLEYSAAIKLAQVHRFAEAVQRLDRVIAGIDKGEEVALLALCPSYFVWRDESGKPQVRTGAFRADIARQRALFASLARLAPGASVTGDARARAFREMADLVVDEPHAFEDLVLHDHVRQESWSIGTSLEGCARNHLSQAAALYEDAAGIATSDLERAQDLLGAARARIALLGFWGEREGHGVLARREELLDDAARACIRAVDAAGERALECELAIAIAFGEMSRDVVDTVRRGRDRSPWGNWSSRRLTRELLRRTVELSRGQDRSELALQGGVDRGR